MKKFIIPLAAGFALGLSGAAMAANVNADHGKVAAQDHSIVATVSGPQLLTDSQMDAIVAGNGPGDYSVYVSGVGICQIVGPDKSPPPGTDRGYGQYNLVAHAYFYLGTTCS